MSRVVAVRHGNDGSIVLYKMDDGTIMNRLEICDAANRGLIEGVSTFTTRDGDEAVRSDRGQGNFRLDELPEF